jgi:hypothetical protein
VRPAFLALLTCRQPSLEWLLLALLGGSLFLYLSHAIVASL